MAAEDSRIVRRGLVLMVLVGVVAASVLIVLLRRAGPDEAPAENWPGKAAALVGATTPGFPADVPWGPLFQVGDGLPSAPGWEIRYTATRVLAKRGSSRLPFAILREMLDEHRQLRNFQGKLGDGRVGPDAGAAGQEVVIALKAVREWHQHAEAVKAVGPNNPELQKLTKAVEQLTRSANNVVRATAQETLLALTKK